MANLITRIFGLSVLEKFLQAIAVRVGYVALFVAVSWAITQIPSPLQEPAQQVVDTGFSIVGGLLGLEEPPLEKPPDFEEIIPTEWTIEYLQQINVDGDSEKEWLLIYRYDKVERGFGGPLGAAVYDPQPDHDPTDLATSEAYRPSSFLPYHLEPRHGGKGYVGEKAGNERPSWSDIVNIYDVEGDGQNELVLRGFSGYPDFPTTLAIFEWVDKNHGYRVMTSAPSQKFLG